MANNYRTRLQYWRAIDHALADWQRAGVSHRPDGSLQLDRTSAQADRDPIPAGKYHSRNFYNGGDFLVGDAVSPIVEAAFPFTEAIPSWNAATPIGTWIEILLRVRIQDRWTKWYNLGVWASDESTIARHSVKDQDDADGRVAADTLALAEAAAAFQIKVRLFSAKAEAAPSVSMISAAYSTMPVKQADSSVGEARYWNTRLPVMPCSQMVYPDGGEVWCSATSTAMVLAYWARNSGGCEPCVKAAVQGVYDWVYDGHGNWPFNTAYAATQGLEGYVARFTSLKQVEPWIAAGAPVIASLAWHDNLSGAPMPTSNGHLIVLIGFDAEGNVIVNDPAAGTNEGVPRTYLRAEFEPLWLQSSGGVVYLIYPPTLNVPPSFAA